MAEAIFKALIDNLSSLIQREVGLIMGVEGEMKKLSSTLATIQNVLEDAQEKRLQSKPIQNWLSKLNGIAFEIDDVLDECAAEVERKGGISKLKKILFHRKIGKRMKEMAKKLDAIAAERNFHLREIAVTQTSEVDARRETGSFLNEPDHIYGRDEDKEKIVNILLSQVTDCHRQQLSVLPIIGVGGLGKTTLAQLVYNDEKVTQHFEVKLWVCVSDNFDLKILLEAIIESATGSAPKDLVHLDTLHRRLLEVLNQKRYLLVLDDVWSDDQERWAMLKSILECGSKGASIVVTTRLKKVADIMGTLPAYCLRGLSEEHCWLLFRLRAFGQENEEHPKLETIGRQIVKKCAAVPLAAKALGGLLRFKRKEKEWIYVRDSEIWNLPEEETLILPALRLSYHHLPLVLRRCFVYCAVFPKDYRIEKEDLIFRWMANGCISSNGTQEVEDVGDQVWNELVLRSFFQEVDTYRIIHTYRSRTTFKMHDLVHDLAQSIMENKIPAAQGKKSGTSASNNERREVNFQDFPRSPLSNTQLLTPIINYNRLRILKLPGDGIKKLPSAIGKLKHLRSLDVSYSFIHTLPRTFCDLWNLQILILNYCGQLKSLPKHITYMTNLRHIFLEGCVSLSHVPSRIRELTSLKTLSLFIVGDRIGNQLDELELLNLGGNLEITHLERTQHHMNAKKANLVEKPNIRKLVLSWEGHGTSEMAKMMDEKVLEALEPHQNLEFLRIDGFKGCYFPLWMKRMENLTIICIRNCPNCSCLPLRDLPCLMSLYLENLVGLEYIVEDETQGQDSVGAKLPSLEYLSLESLPNLKGLSKEEVGEIFPHLRGLYINACKLLRLPPLASLETLEAIECSPLTVSSFSQLENLTSLKLEFYDEDKATCIPKENIYEAPYNLQKLMVRIVGEDCLPERWGRGLKYLKVLKMEKTASFPNKWLSQLTTLEKLVIFDCKECVAPDEIKGLHLLKHLKLHYLDDMTTLPQVIQHRPSLQSLTLWALPELISLPEWLGNLTSLEVFDIRDCEKVASVPSSLRGMTNLRILTISGCPQLMRRCEKENGEDSHKIAHIPQLQIGFYSRVIYSRGRIRGGRFVTEQCDDEEW